jgi:NadR type nicotinamide-nucleotide adenylyltransferase
MVPKIVITGSECTGKTTLAGQLAAEYETIASVEFARRYLDVKAAPLDVFDVEPIAHGQMAEEDAAALAASRLLVLDTDLVSTVVYARHYYGGCPDWIVRAARARLADAYLLLMPDVPWVPDGTQRDRPHARAEIHVAFLETLRSFGARVHEIAGTWDRRRQAARNIVESLLKVKRT